MPGSAKVAESCCMRSLLLPGVGANTGPVSRVNAEAAQKGEGGGA
eukprot:CAMPEP_0115293980 /NCGR_PEP_ID=MMETSP0270-20121206/65948_1 /TAXON_ID=71861 /ORGANISM="Scrippsiella trochoidea, Strain CCMP3099" /LENGTH=44 /DNA_ID= /DNA_START= /DNA_END= /DNA_ORIENTATION=